MANNFEQLPQEQFVLVNENRPLKDKELVTKPRGFFADAMYRFSRNKGSIVAAGIIGVLFLYAIIAPLCTPYKVATADTYLKYCLPKIHDNPNVDFYDGCDTKTTSEINFVENYAIGAETGVNAIKRQAYTTGVSSIGETTYTYRLDSYRKTGNIFMKGVSRDTLESIQAYQDEMGIQIIYPITDPAQRPTAAQDLKNANFWYKTEYIDGRTTPVEYTINEDGTVTYQNIYKEYARPSLSSVQNFNTTSGPNAKLTPVSGGFTIALTSAVEEEEEEEVEGGTDTSDIDDVLEYETNYLSMSTEDNLNFISFVKSADEASVFNYDATNGGIYAEINGHDDPTLDGEYLLGIGAERGSAIGLIKSSEYSASDYVLLNAFGGDQGKTKITDFSAEKNCYLASVRTNYTTTKNYVNLNSMDGSIGLVNSSSASAKLTFTAKDDGYTIKFGKPAKYVKLVANGNNTIESSATSADDASIWHYDAENGSMYVNVTGHTDASFDGAYYWALKLDGDEPAAVIARKADFTANLVPFVVYATADTKATDLSEGQLYLMAESQKDNSTMYYANGYFNGDNYHSKMRVEGEGNYKYAYAISHGSSFEIRVNYYEYYRYYHSYILKDGINYPMFIFGANDSGQDIFVCLASGARFSFILAIVVSVVNMLVGAIYGAIEGYYGGKADLIMERISEILSAVPFMIVITLLKYHMGGTSQAIILFIAFFLTGWIGEAGLVRMQFYRFKNQEYVLASRTLGARDWRIMFKHIFPNALGTIVTSSVLVIPSMIFSETSLSYLGIINLNTGDMTSVGTLLAGGQPYLTTYPHIIIFPAIFISLLMLTFNLFGNGLRDAFNPSLRGTED
ncbi:MAG: ABC transporter permease [Bacilli bacterium]|nr:ABC transporter permease [Bacilli bacterium]